MVKKISVVVMVFVFIGGFLGAESSASLIKRNEKEQAAYALLDQIISMFQGMAATGSGGEDLVRPQLDEMMADAKKNLAEEKIDPVFFHGFQRMLSVIKLIVIKDKEGILGPIIQKEVGGYVLETTGKEVNLLDESQTIGSVADAIAQGILNLHLYLDTKEQREKLWETIEKRFEKTTQKK
ncbi:MAG: hypothetical protein JXB26_01865 [Candidatus Aminicenantes bacterium]|nr:hypothetical protein [Candidatus Aminicenantes bacterium]